MKMIFDKVISNFKKQILRSVECVWAKIHPVMFVHSSDLMLPGDTGLTSIQLIVISRLLDMEERNSTGSHYWHIRIAELCYKKEYTSKEKEELDMKFERFFQSMKKRGFNPSLSHISVAHLPVMGQSDGTHRMGYLLSEKANVFVPVQILSPISWTGKSVDGISWLSQIQMPADEIKQLLERYRKLHSEMRRYIIAVVDKSVFDQNEAALMQEIDGIGKCIEMKYADKKNNNCKKLKIPKQYKKFFNNKEKIVILEIEIEYQILYYKRGRLKSKLTDLLADRLYKLIGAEGYVAGTITESIALETYLDEKYCIEPYMKNI